MAEHSALSPTIIVRGNQLTYKGLIFPCAIGKGGVSQHKKEGDGCTPVGIYALRECWWRQDKLHHAPKTGLRLRVTNEEDGWCDEPSSPHYNQPVKLPYSLSHEKMWRDDDVYDIVVPLGYNDDPVIPGKGSAIFMHLARPGYEPTEGCVALAKDHMLELLALCTPDSRIEIVQP
jgi:L,D-peptidoglycan transpeptidase YkuD (ErfK/YbiS/YcfS/YnhG family)